MPLRIVGLRAIAPRGRARDLAGAHGGRLRADRRAQAAPRRTASSWQA